MNELAMRPFASPDDLREAVRGQFGDGFKNFARHDRNIVARRRFRSQYSLPENRSAVAG